MRPKRSSCHMGEDESPGDESSAVADPHTIAAPQDAYGGTGANTGGQKWFYSPRTHPWAPRTKRGAELSQKELRGHTGWMLPSTGRGTGGTMLAQSPRAGKGGVFTLGCPSPIALSSCSVHGKLSAGGTDSGQGQLSASLPEHRVQPHTGCRPQSPPGPQLISLPGINQPDEHQGFGE